MDFHCAHQERNIERAAPLKPGGAADGATQPGSLQAGDEGKVYPKLRRVVGNSLIHVPSLALDNLLAADGVLRRPYENVAEERQDILQEQNDTDSLSAYEDASAETPEQDTLFPGTADIELQHDSESSAQISEDKNQEPKPGEQCIVS